MAKVPMVSISMTVLKPFTLISSAEACRSGCLLRLYDTYETGCCQFVGVSDAITFSILVCWGQLGSTLVLPSAAATDSSTALPLTKPPMKGTLCSWEDTYLELLLLYYHVRHN